MNPSARKGLLEAPPLKLLDQNLGEQFEEPDRGMGQSYRS